MVTAFGCKLHAQPILTPIQTNAVIKAHLATKPDRHSGSYRGISDTLDLPFFDDFTTTTVYPDNRKWTDSLVFINSNFPIKPPSYGVATFDNLNKFGNPYVFLNNNLRIRSDSLTSQPINLSFYKQGINTIPYAVSDSIYLSFFYQATGLGDVLEPGDSLVLEFKTASGAWISVLKLPGQSQKEFKQVLIPVNQSFFLHEAFQFRFVNYSKASGNMNHWHVDYVRMARNRTYNDFSINDVAISNFPKSLLSNYFAMPFDHFKVNPLANTRTNQSLFVNNLANATVQVRFQYEAYNRFNQQVGFSPFTASNRNIFANSDSTELFSSFPIDTFNGRYFSLRRRMLIDPLSNDNTPGSYNSLGNNNILDIKQEFGNYFAYDDGTAEAGFGLDYASLPNGPGYVANKFILAKQDTLRGIGIFFNQSVESASFKSFTLMVWKSLSEPPASNMSNDVVVVSLDIPGPVYTDSVNGFHYFLFDSAIVLPAGAFYVGWKQNFNYILNVGYDNNYRFNDQNTRNPNIFYNLLGFWEKPDFEIQGALMVRPLVGKEVNYSMHIENKTLPIIGSVYPNPSDNKIFIKMPETMPVQYELLTLDGKVIAAGVYQETGIEVSLLSKGIYFIKVSNKEGTMFLVKKIIIQH